VVDQWYSQAIVIAARRLVSDWPLQRVEELTVEHLATIFELQPDIVIIGTGNRQHFLPPLLMMEFLGQGIGAEVMSTAAACRTFNVLVSEGRNVVAALLPPSN
jgi:uncharacterized protein